MNSITNTIHYRDAQSARDKGTGIIIDVREPAEFRERHIPYAINLPSSQFIATAYQAWGHLEIFLVCQSGDRALGVAQKLRAAGVKHVFVLDRHMDEMEQETPVNVWSVDRQFRFLLGVLLGLYLLGYHWLSDDSFSVIPVILCLGLTITAIIDKCYLRVGIAMLPWNRVQSQWE